MEDIKIINSPVGMPGRAFCNKFIKNTNEKIIGIWNLAFGNWNKNY